MQKLKDSELRYRRLFETAQDGILILDAETGMIEDVNPYLIKMLGYSRAEFIKKKLWEVGAFKDIEASKEAFEALLEKEYIRYEDLPLKTKDGRLVQVEFVSNVYQVGDEKVIQCDIREITERKGTEKALNESEAKYQALFENALVGMYRSKLDGSAILDVNQKLADIFGYSIEEMLVEPATIRWANLDARNKMVRRVREKGQLADYDVAIVTKNGETRTLLTSIKLYPDEGYLLGSAIDITERKQAEVALHESEDKFSKAFQTSPYAITITRPEDGTFIEVNDAFTSMTGFTREEVLIGSSVGLKLWVNEEDRQRVVATLRAGQAVVGKEYPFRTKSGKVITGIFSAQVIKLSQGLCILSSINNITERKRAEEALAESEKKLRSLFETMSEGVVYENHDGKIISANPAAERLLGLSFNQMQGRTSVDPRWKAIHADGSPFPGETHSLNVAAKTGKPAIGEVMGIYNPKSDAYVWLSVNSTPEFLPGEKKPFQAYAVFRDITERKQAEEALASSEQFLSNVIEQSPVSLWISDSEGTLIKMNQACRELFGITDEEAVGKYNLLKDNLIEAQGFMALVRDVFEKGAIARFSIDYDLPRVEHIEVKKGTHRILDVVLSPIKDIRGKLTNVLVQHKDITERKQVEEELRESENTVLAWLNAIQESAFLMDREGIILAVNATTAERLHRSVEELVGACIYDFIPPQTAQSRRQHIAQVIESGQPVRFEDERFGRVIDNLIYPVLDQSGQVKHMAILGTDITERKQAEDALRMSESHFRQLSNSLPQLVWTCQADGPCDFLSQQWVAFTGLPEEQQLGYGWLDQLHADDRAPTVAAWEAANASGTDFHFEFRIRRHDGVYRWFDTQAVRLRDSQGNTVKWFGSNTDITERIQAEQEIRNLNAELEQRVIERTAQLQTANKQLESELAERKRAEKALRESEEQFRSLSEAAFEAIIIHDGGLLLNTNKQFCDMFGYDPEGLLGKQVMPLTIAPEAIEIVKKEIATGGVGPYESTGLKKDGTRFPMEIRGREMEYKGRKVRMAAIMDITERKRAGEALQQRTIQLEAANKELEAFSYSVSHDLRAPLRGIDGWSLALLEDYGGQLDGQAKSYLERVRSETQRMGHLIDDLLQLSRLTRVEMRAERVNLSAMAQTIAARLQESEPQRQVKFKIQKGLSARGDTSLLEVALTNLLDNAFKFTGKTPQARIEFGQTEIEGQRAFFVRDNGAGFDMAFAKKLFGVFQRLHKASEFPGTGVGLATVQRILHRHAGHIWVEAAVNQGATFYFTLDEIP